MYFVHFFESRNPLLCQFLKQVPAIGDEIVIKGRKGKVSSIDQPDEKTVHLQLTFESVQKNKIATLDPSKKKKR